MAPVVDTKEVVDRFTGCVLGLAIGDAMGAPYEGGILERALWRFIGRTRDGRRRWTDDTQMSIDIMESIIALGRIDSDDLSARFARSYHWSRGYGPATAKVLKRIRRGVHWSRASYSVFRDGSFGNGAAMRAPIIGLFDALTPERIKQSAAASAIVTHAHELAMQGAQLIAHAVAASVMRKSNEEILNLMTEIALDEQFRSRLAKVRQWRESGDQPSPQEVAKTLGNGIAATRSCVTALYIALAFHDQPISDMLRFVARIRGDTDTIGAMAGAIWGARNGASEIPDELVTAIEQHQRLRELSLALYQRTITTPRL